MVCLPKEDREKVLSQYISMMPENIDEKDKKMPEMAVRSVVDKKLAEEKATDCRGSPTGTPRGPESGDGLWKACGRNVWEDICQG